MFSALENGMGDWEQEEKPEADVRVMPANSLVTLEV